MVTLNLINQRWSLSCRDDVTSEVNDVTSRPPTTLTLYSTRHNCRGITRIHRSPSRPSHPYGRQPHSLIFMSTLYKATCCLPRQQLTSDHKPACMCHLYRLRIKTHVLTSYHALLYRATWWQLGLNSKEDICVSLCQLLVWALAGQVPLRLLA